MCSVRHFGFASVIGHSIVENISQQATLASHICSVLGKKTVPTHCLYSRDGKYIVAGSQVRGVRQGVSLSACYQFSGQEMLVCVCVIVFVCLGVLMHFKRNRYQLPKCFRAVAFL